MRQFQNIIVLLSLSLLMVNVKADEATKESNDSSLTEAFKDFPSCNAQDEDINECLRKVFNQIFPRSRNGIPEINVPPMDPFLLNKTTFLFSHPMVQGRVSVRNFKVYGIGDTTIKNAEYTRTGNSATLKLRGLLPKVFAEGEYRAKIKVNGVKVSSKGAFNVTFTEMDVIVEGSADLIEKDGHRYMNIKNFNIEPNVATMKFYANGLFEDPLLNEAALELINQNWRNLYKGLIAETRNAWEPEIIKICNLYFSHTPVDFFVKGE